MSEQGRLINPQDAGLPKQESCTRCGFTGLLHGACVRCGAGVQRGAVTKGKKRKVARR